ncbi:MAG: hypothetical protein JNL53_19355, partial [Cyclobacteriaceae bacterium]|nr:hypothetical protein [Cyclobacteriaceae bacterium]
MKTLSIIIFLATITFSVQGQKPNADDVTTVITTLEAYKKAIEKLDT